MYKAVILFFNIIAATDQTSLSCVNLVAMISYLKAQK